MSLSTLTTYYADLLAYQYRGLPNATRQTKLWTKQFVADFMASQLLTCFDIETAVGNQLDILGKYVGVSRNLGIVIARPYFSLWTYNSTLSPALYQASWDPATNDPVVPAADPSNAGWWYVAGSSGVSTSPIAATFAAGNILVSDGATWAKQTADNGNGLTSYSSLGVNANGVFYRYQYASGQNSDLTDAQYRAVIKLKAILNSNDGTLPGILAYLQKFFPGQISLVDNKDMTLTYLVLSSVALSQELLTVYLPKPMGVGISVIIVSPTPGGEGRLATEDGDILTTEDGSPLVTETT